MPHEPRYSRRTLLAGAALGAALGPACRKKTMTSQAPRMPTLYLPHGGGPCFFMEWTMGPPDTWDRTQAWLEALPGSLPRPPTALLVISAHWEAPHPTVTTAAQPELIYDYYGFPEHTYALSWPAPGAPEVAARVKARLDDAGFDGRADPTRGFDHGVFVPLKVAWPDASVPTVALSLLEGLDPAAHLALGRALAPLREEGVLIVGSGMSYHHMRGFNRPESYPISKRFDDWLTETTALPAPDRARRLTRWADAPEARACHPREEHLLPLMVCAGAAGEDRGQRVFGDRVMGVEVSAHRFG